MEPVDSTSTITYTIGLRRRTLEELIRASKQYLYGIQEFARVHDRYRKAINDLADKNLLSTLPKPIPLSVLRAFQIWHDFELPEHGKPVLGRIIRRELKGNLFDSLPLFSIPSLVEFRDKDNRDGDEVLLTDEIWRTYGKKRKVGDVVEWEGQKAVIVQCWNGGSDRCLVLVSTNEINPDL